MKCALGFDKQTGMFPAFSREEIERVPLGDDSQNSQEKNQPNFGSRVGLSEGDLELMREHGIEEFYVEGKVICRQGARVLFNF